MQLPAGLSSVHGQAYTARPAREWVTRYRRRNNQRRPHSEVARDVALLPIAPSRPDVTPLSEGTDRSTSPPQLPSPSTIWSLSLTVP